MYILLMIFQEEHFQSCCQLKNQTFLRQFTNKHQKHSRPQNSYQRRTLKKQNQNLIQNNSSLFRIKKESAYLITKKDIRQYEETINQRINHSNQQKLMARMIDRNQTKKSLYLDNQISLNDSRNNSEFKLNQVYSDKNIKKIENYRQAQNIDSNKKICFQKKRKHEQKINQNEKKQKIQENQKQLRQKQQQEMKANNQRKLNRHSQLIKQLRNTQINSIWSKQTYRLCLYVFEDEAIKNFIIAKDGLLQKGKAHQLTLQLISSQFRYQENHIIKLCQYNKKSKLKMGLTVCSRIRQLQKNIFNQILNRLVEVFEYLQNKSCQDSLTQEQFQYYDWKQSIKPNFYDDFFIKNFPQKLNLIDEKQKCPICHQKIRMLQFITKLKCNHCFHSDCIQQWLKKATTCPICRTEQYKCYSASEYYYIA